MKSLNKQELAGFLQFKMQQLEENWDSNYNTET